jgi:hypothetical protein
VDALEQPVGVDLVLLVVLHVADGLVLEHQEPALVLGQRPDGPHLLVGGLVAQELHQLHRLGTVQERLVVGDLQLRQVAPHGHRLGTGLPPELRLLLLGGGLAVRLRREGRKRHQGGGQCQPAGP